MDNCMQHHNNNMQPMQLAHHQQLQQLQPNIKSFASPSITPSSNYRVGSHHQQVREQANVSINNLSQVVQPNNFASNGPQSIRNDISTSSNIHGRRSSPEVKVAVNREIQEQRPHTAGNPFVQYNSAAPGGGSLAYYRNEEYLTLMNNNQGHHETNIHTSAINSAQNTITLSNHRYKNSSGNANLNPRHHRGQPSQSNHENAQNNGNTKTNNRGNVTLQHDESAAIRSGRQKTVASKSQHPNMKKKKNQTSRSAPRVGNSQLSNNYQNTPAAHQLININIHGVNKATSLQQTQHAKVQHPGAVSQNLIANVAQRKRADPTKFFSQGNGAAMMAGLMSAPNKSKSRSRSQKRKNEVVNALAVQKPVAAGLNSNVKQTGNLKPPRQNNHHLNKSSINHQKDTIDVMGGNGGGPGDNGYSFDHKDNDSLNFIEFSPSRLIDGAPGAPSAIGKRKSKINDINNFLDSDSSISSPKSQNNHKNLHAVEAASSGPQTVKGYYMDKGAFLKHFSPDRNGDASISHPGAPHHSNHLLSSDRERLLSSDAAARIATNQAKPSKKEGGPPAQKKCRLNKKLVEQLMRENFKQLRAKEEAEEMSRRKLHNDALIQKELLKKAQELHQTSQRAINNAVRNKNNMGGGGGRKYQQHKNHQENSGAQLKLAGLAQTSQGNIKNYKKQRSKSCMNKTDNIFGVPLPRSKERQQQLHQHLQLPNQNLSNSNISSLGTVEPPKAVETYQPKQPTQQPTQKRREKSCIQEINELNRRCTEELKKEFKFGPNVEGGLPSNTSNKRISNIANVFVNKKDAKQTQSANNQLNQQSLNELHPEFKLPTRVVLNPNITNKILKYKEKKKYLQVAFPKSMEQTINQKKIKTNLGKLDERVKQIRHGNNNFVIKKPLNNLVAQNLSHVTIGSNRPEQKLKTQFFENDKPTTKGVFNYQLEANLSTNQKQALTPSKAQILEFAGACANDISLEVPEQFQRLLNQIESGHEHYHHHQETVTQSKPHVSKSNPPAGNRKNHNMISDQHSGYQAVPPPDSFSIDVSSIHHRDSSLNNVRRIHNDRQNITVPQVQLEGSGVSESRKPNHQFRQFANSSNKKSSNSKGEGRSNSSPNTINANPNLLNSIVQSNSEANNITPSQVTRGNGTKSAAANTNNSNALPKPSDLGSNSNISIHELQSKIRMLTQFYGPHIRSMEQNKGEGRARITKTQMLVKLHSAAIVIQQNFRKYKARKGFYTNSLTYINTSEDETFTNKDMTIYDDQVKQQPPYDSISPDKPILYQPANNENPKKNESNSIIVPNGNQFYSLNSSIVGKVVQLSVISSGRPDESRSFAKGESAENSNQQSQIITPNNFDLAKNGIPKIEIPQIQTSQLPSGFSTVIKNSKDTTNQVSMIDEESKTASPAATGQPRDTPSKDSSSRKNIVPLLNLSKLDITDKDSANTLIPAHHPNLHFAESKDHSSSHQQSKTMFGRQPFHDFFETHNLDPTGTGFDMHKYPDMLQMREEIIKRKSESDQRLLSQRFKLQEFSPRTYDIKRNEIEKWVTKEKEEVKLSRKRYEEEFKKTQFMLSEVQINKNLYKIINDQPTTHRSRIGQDNPSGDVSYRIRADSNKGINSARHIEKPYLDTLEDQQNIQNELSRRSSLPPEEIQATLHNNINGLSQLSKEHLLHNQDLQHIKDTTNRRQDLPNLLGYDNFISTHQKPQGSNIVVQDERKSNDDDETPFQPIETSNSDMNSSPDQNDQENNQPKGLSRTKNSIQLQDFDNIDNNDSNNWDRQDINNSREQKYLETTNQHGTFIDENNLSSDPRDHKLIDTSPEGQSPFDLKDKMKSDQFFLKNFDKGDAKDVIEQVINLKKVSPPNGFTLPFADDNSHQKKDHSNESSKDKSAPSQSPAHQRENYHKEISLDDINLQLPINDFNNVAVSPVSNPDIPIDTVGSGNGGLGQVGDNHIITGGASLNSTLSAGNDSGHGNQELVRAIQEVKQDLNPNKVVAEVQDIKDQQDNLNEHEGLANQITDEIYQNLLGELKLDLELLLLNDPRIQNLASKPTDTREKTQPTLGDSGRFPIFDRRGIQTDLFAIERYVEEVLQEVLLEKERFMFNMLEPIKKSPRDVLNQLQNSEIGSYEHFEQHYPPVLALETYLKLERRRKDQRMLEQSEGSNMSSPNAAETRNFLAECEHIHNKTLFDCINDSLLQFKPFAKDGEPLPWSRQNRRLKPTEEFTVEEMFEIVKHDLFRWAIIQAGTLPRREFVFGGHFDEELFAEIREKKLATLLAREMIENEPRWLNYEFEDAQVKIDIGDMILEQLVTETITILNEKMGPGAPSSSNAVANAIGDIFRDALL